MLLVLFGLLALMISILVGAATNFFAGLAVFVLLVGSCILQGMRRIPADPLTKAIKTLFGALQDKVLGPGWHFFLFYPFAEGYVKVNGAKVNQLIPLEMLTPDGISNKIPVSVE